jgi:hypothetical protein
VFLNLAVVEGSGAMATFSTDLTTMNKTSIKFTQWAARVTDSDSFSYTFTAKKTGNVVTSHKFECRLVGSSATAYVLAVLKGTESEVSAAKKTFQNGSTWEVSKVKFEENTSPVFISSALRVSVDLKKSNLRLSEDADLDHRLAKTAIPPRTVAETSKITSTRHQDLMAIVTQIEPIRNTKRGDVLDVTVMDASEDSPGVYAKVLVSVWGSTNQKKVAIGKPLVFFNLVCKLEEGSKQFNHWDDSLLCEAPECDKRNGLTKDFDKIKDATNSVMLTNFTPKASMDVSGPQSIAASAFLDYTSQNPDANLPSVMQIMVATIEEPNGSVNPEGTDRIWFLAKFREFSGAAEASMSERVALQLSGLDRAGFMDAHASGTLQFPLLCNLRVSRSISTGASGQSGASQPGAAADKKTFVNHAIQDARPIDWNNSVAPNAAYEEVLTVLNKLPGNEDGLLFAFLADIEPDPHTGFRVTFENGTISKGAAVAVLIASRKKNKLPEALGEGFKICAQGVCDVANPMAVGASQQDNTVATYNVSGFCTLTDMSKFDLNPPRGHTQRFAIALITSCEQTEQTGASQSGVKTFHMDKIQILEQADGPKAVPAFQRLRRLTMRLNPSSQEERKHNLDIGEGPSRSLKKCRTLSAMPTDESLQEQPLSQTK